MDTKAIEKTIKLLAKVGLFFAKADGKYTDKEENFIAKFIDRLAGDGDDRKEAEALLEGYLDKTFTLDEIIADTKDLLSGFNETEQGVITLMLNGFIDQVIEADGKESAAELKNYEAWQKAIAE